MTSFHQSFRPFHQSDGGAGRVGNNRDASFKKLRLRSDQQLATDEGYLRVFWRKWNELMEPRA